MFYTAVNCRHVYVGRAGVFQVITPLFDTSGFYTVIQNVWLWNVIVWSLTFAPIQSYVN